MDDPTQADVLFGRAATGDRAALDELLERYLPLMHAFVTARLGPALRPRESSVDIVQSVCRELLSAQGAFARDSEERFRAWLFTSALNKIREKARHHRMQKRDLMREEAVAEDRALSALASMLTPSREAVGRETAAAVADALAAMSEEHREVITLARVVQLPHALIAEAMDRSEEASRQLLGRALTRLARELRARGVDVSGTGRV